MPTDNNHFFFYVQISWKNFSHTERSLMIIRKWLTFRTILQTFVLFNGALKCRALVYRNFTSLSVRRTLDSWCCHGCFHALLRYGLFPGPCDALDVHYDAVMCTVRERTVNLARPRARRCCCSCSMHLQQFISPRAFSPPIRRQTPSRTLSQLHFSFYPPKEKQL